MAPTIQLVKNPGARKKEFQWLNKIGVKGIKVDFFQSDKQGIMRQYTDILEDAAENKLVLNFRGCTLPRGWRRTYPNLLTIESVRGAECYRFVREFPAAAPMFNTIYPFTRNVVGPMDYTPVTFSHNVLPHHYDAYRAQPEYVREFLKKVPAVWDETILIDGYPGKNIIIARKSGDTWYVGGLNGEFSDKSFAVDLDFLENGNYEATIITDGNKNDRFLTFNKNVGKNDEITVNVLRYSGFVIVLKPVKM